MSTGKIELSVGAVKIANKHEIFTEEEINNINKIPAIEDELEETVKFEIIGEGTTVPPISGGGSNYDDTEIREMINEVNSSLDNIVHIVNPNMSTSEIQDILNKTGDIKFISGVYELDYNIVNETTNANGVRDVALYLDVKSNTRIYFEKNITINIKDCVLDWYRIFRIYNQENIEIHGGVINGDRVNHIQQIKDGQWGYGIHISNSKNIMIKNVHVNGCYGDGICVGNSENVFIHKCISSNNRRQALTIGSGENITVDDCKFLNTNGQAPQSGIDIEPDLATQKVKNIVIKNCVIDGNNGSGIELNLSKLNVESEQNVHTVSIFIDNCKISNNKDGIMYTYLPDNKDLLNNVNGFIKVTNSHIFENSRGSILLLNILDKKMPTLICDNLHLSRWGSFGIGFQRYSLNDGASENNIVEYGGCYFSNISFFECPNTSDYDCPIYIQPYDYVKFNSIFKDINIIDNIARNRWCVWKDGEGHINYINNDKSIEINNSISYARLNGLEVKFNNGSTFTLPSPEHLKGREFTFINNKEGQHFTLKTEENTEFDDTFVEGINVVVKGNSSYLKIRSNSSNTWQTVEKIGKVLPTGFTSEKKILFGGSSPTSGTWEIGDKIYNTNPTTKAVEYWICMESGTPGTWTYGGVCDLKKMDAISDSTSIDEINTKFNTLLSRLRTSGLLRE